MHGNEDDFCSLRIPFEGFIELLYFAVGYYSSPPGLLDYYE